LQLPGVLLFAVMFLWQVPHFLAITLFRKEEYARAGLVVQPNEPGGERAARMNIVRYTVALVAVSLLFVPIGAAHGLYLGTALLAGLAFLGYGLLGLRSDAGPAWARNLFLFSLIYLPVVFGALMVDRAARMHSVRYPLALLAVSLLFVPIGAAHGLYLGTALLAGLAFLGYGLLGLRSDAGPAWARNLFLFSLIYLPVVFGALMVDR